MARPWREWIRLGFPKSTPDCRTGLPSGSNGGAEGAAEENRLRRIDAQRIARKVERRFTVEISAFLRGAPGAAPIVSVVRMKILTRVFSWSSLMFPLDGRCRRRCRETKPAWSALGAGE